MKTLTRSIGYRSNWMLSVTFTLGVLLLAGTWIAIYWEESLFTESHLVGYYCCVTEQDLPDPGTLERTLSDFFRTSPGRHLPSLIFVGANAGLFAISMRRGRGTGWWLPFLFVAFNIFYLLAEFNLVVASWSLSDRLVGPQTGAYKGYHRTWYGIILHLILWGAFLITLWGLTGKLLPRRQASKELDGS